MARTSATFRPELQGLRALAVSMVVVYHVADQLVPGGFFGVDIFFVLSGYLITQVLLREDRRHVLARLLSFWGQRIRRLLPNAALVLVATMLAAQLLVPSFRVAPVLEDVRAAMLYFANFRFIETTTDYFSFESTPSPVLHFWSLALEEQFYLVWPVLLLATGLLAARFFRAALAGLLAAIWLGSFLWCLAAAAESQPLAFFHPASRAWELATGAFLAVFAGGSRALPAEWRGVAIFLGLGLILFAAMLPDSNFAHPGWITLLPVAGAALVILPGPGPAPARFSVETLLRCRPVTALGDISYSLYLWHWPVLVFAAAMFPGHPLAAPIALLIGLLLSILAYNLVERPLHRGRLTAGLPAQLGIAVTTIGLVIGASLTVTGRIPDSAAAQLWTDALTAARRDLPLPYADNCHLDFEEIDQPDCAYASIGAERLAILYGDSHAAQWFPALETAAEAAGWELRSWTKSSCPSLPVFVWYEPRQRWFDECTQWQQSTFDRLMALPPATIFIANSAFYFDGWMEAVGGGPVLPAGQARRAWRAALADIADTLTAAGHRVVFIRDTPRQPLLYGDCLVLALSASCGRHVAGALAPIEDSMPPVTPAGVEWLDLTDDLCPDGWCASSRQGAVIYRDHHHLTATAARSFAGRFDTLLRQ